MPESLEHLVEKYHVFYDVSPYQVLIEERHGSPAATRHIIQAGFDVDVHGLSNEREIELPPPADYATAYARLKEIADTISHHATDCFIEVIPFPSTVFSEAREHFRSEAVVRIRISHRGADQAVGPPEEHALEELEEQLQHMGIRRK